MTVANRQMDSTNHYHISQDIKLSWIYVAAKSLRLNYIDV